jgi:Flp pilus assembly protein TadG
VIAMAGSRNRWATVGNNRDLKPLLPTPRDRGQALVEFTLIFILLLILAWIPADFGLAFYTGQLAQNAAREGARIAAVDPDLPTQTGSCAYPCAGAPAGSALAATAARLSSALLNSVTITVAYPIGAAACNQKVRVQVSGNYNFFFYQLINLLGWPVNPAITINRTTEMRWEHQAGCIATGGSGGAN